MDPTRWAPAFAGEGAELRRRPPEVCGTVTVHHQGLFADLGYHHVSLALFPDEGQTVAQRPPRVLQIDVIGIPAFGTVQKG